MADYGGYNGYSADSVKRSRALADAMFQRSQQERGQPIQSWTQGAARLADAYFAREAGERANSMEAEYQASQKKLGDAMLAQMFPEAATAPTEGAPAFDLTPGAFENRRAQTGLSQTVRSMADLNGDPLAAAETGLALQKHQRELAKLGNPTLFNRPEGVMAVTSDGAQATVVPGTETDPRQKAPGTALGGTLRWDEEVGDYVPIEGAFDQYLKMHPPGGSAGSGPRLSAGYRWGPDGTQEAIPGGPADPTRNGAPMDPKMIQLEMQAADDWDRIYKDFSNVNQQYQRAKDVGTLAAKDPGSRSAADLALVVTITKMLDPTSVAREGEVKLTQSSAPVVAQATNLLNQWINGKTILPDETRQALLNLADTLMPSYRTAYLQRAKDAYSRAESYGFDPKRVMMGYDVTTLAPKQAMSANDVPPGMTPQEWQDYQALQQKFGGQ